MYINKHFTYEEKEINQLIKMVTGVGYAPEQIKIIATVNHSQNPIVNFVCSHSSTLTIVKLEEFLECQGLSRSYSNVKIIHNKPWWKPFKRKIIGFSLDVKIDLD